MGLEEGYEMRVGPFQPELGLIGMQVLSLVISASSYERNWTAHGHVHSEVRNRLAPAMNKKLLYIYYTVVAAAHDD